MDVGRRIERNGGGTGLRLSAPIGSDLADISLTLAAGEWYVLLVLDEAFNGLDPASALMVKRHLRERLQERGAALLLAKHSLDIVKHHADRAAVLIDGRLKRECEIDGLRIGQNFETSLAATIGS